MIVVREPQLVIGLDPFSVSTSANSIRGIILWTRDLRLKINVGFEMKRKKRIFAVEVAHSHPNLMNFEVRATGKLSIVSFELVIVKPTLT